MEWIRAPEARPAGDYVSASRKRIIAVVSAPILTLNRHSQSRSHESRGTAIMTGSDYAGRFPFVAVITIDVLVEAISFLLRAERSIETSSKK
jgi:hypothetical protein